MQTPERQLVLEVQVVRALREALSALTDEDGINIAIEGETNLKEAISAVLDQITEDEALCAGLRVKIEEMVNRRLRFETRIDHRRAAIERAMSFAEVHRLEYPAATLSLRRVPPGLEIIAETEIPTEFFKPQPPKLDRAALKDALKAGTDVPGARLDNGSIGLTVRRA